MPVEEYSLAHLRDAVAMVLQKNTLFSGSLRENLLWGNPEAPDEELLRACRIARVDEFLDRLENGLDTEMGQGGSNISGGQKQRICIARAILKKPKILILDDFTGAVDTATEAEIQKRLREELPHMTRIIIAQRISSVKQRNCLIKIPRPSWFWKRERSSREGIIRSFWKKKGAIISYIQEKWSWIKTNQNIQACILSRKSVVLEMTETSGRNEYDSRRIDRNA